MKKQGNFSKAIDELMQGHVFSATSMNNAEPAAGSRKPSGAQSQPGFAAPDSSTTLEETKELSISSQTPPAAQSALVKSPQPEAMSTYVVEPSRTNFHGEEARITKDMTIRGSIVTGSDVRIVGSVYGDVEAKGDVYISGIVEGRITAQSIVLDSASIKGDIHSGTSVIIGKNTRQSGDIEADHVEIDGMLNGNVSAHGHVILKSCAIVEGNIKASTLAMAEGAEVKGSLDIAKSR